jgi:hypothetical protein
MKRISVCYYLLTITLCFLTAKTALAEDISISTFYPSPYGNYQELETTGNTSLATTSGSVGVGTTGALAEAAGNKLEVNGIGQFSGTTQIGAVTQGYYGDGTNLAIRGFNNPAGGTFFQTFGGGSTNMTIANNGNITLTPTGNVGIGTAAPTQKLDVVGNAMVNGSLGIGRLPPPPLAFPLSPSGLAVEGDVMAFRHCDAAARNTCMRTFNNSLDFYVENTFVMSMVDGRVIIGPTLPSAMLTVAGAIKIGEGGMTGPPGCDPLKAGAIRYHAGTKKINFCDGITWVELAVV